MPEPGKSRSSRRVGGRDGNPGAVMAVNIVLYIGGPVAALFLPGGDDFEGLVNWSGGLSAFVWSIVEIVLIGVVWGAVYALTDAAVDPGTGRAGCTGCRSRRYPWC